MSEPNDEPCEQPRAIIFWSLVTSPIFTLLSLLSKDDLRSEEDERIMSKAIILQFVYNKGIAKRFKGFTNIFSSSSQTQGQSRGPPEIPKMKCIMLQMTS